MVSRGSEPKLFVWRGEDKFDGGMWNPVMAPLQERCPYCQGEYLSKRMLPSGLADHGDAGENTCVRCGFRWTFEHGFGLVDSWSWCRIATLVSLAINDASLGLDEIGTHLQRKFSDVYGLGPRRFEDLVGDVYGNLGYSVRRTPTHGDGGYDLILLEHATGKQIIVEVKRYARERKVGVEIARQVLGVQFLDHFEHAVIVTSSSFTKGATEVSRRINAGRNGFRLDLVSATEFLRMLRVYNEALPPLDCIDIQQFPFGGRS